MNHNITVIMKDKNFAKALARGIVEGSKLKGLRIQVRGREDGLSDTESQVIVTDCKELQQIYGKEDNLVLLIIDGYSVNIEELLEKIYEKIEEKKAVAGSGKEACIIGFFSPLGGSGTTTIAISIGRILSGGYGERCLYISMTGRREEADYVKVKAEKKSVKELIFRLRKNLPVLIEKYIFQDAYGLEFLESWPLSFDGDDESSDLKNLSAFGTYDWILLDYGKSYPNDACQVKVKIENAQDCRSARENMDADILLSNRENKLSMEEENRYAIPYDEDGFRFHPSLGITELCLTSSFGIGLKKVASNLMEQKA